MSSPYVDYGSNSSLHGVGYLLDPQARSGHRLLWLLVFVTSLALAISLTHQAYVHWQENQVLLLISFKGDIFQFPHPLWSASSINASRL